MENETSFTIKRARPALGTIVEITITSTDKENSKKTISKCFEKISELEAIFSFHNSESEIRRLCETAHLKPQTVSFDLYRLLKMSRYFYIFSDGLFDVAFGGSTDNNIFGISSDIVLLSNRTVFFKRPLQIDFGGIAKGYIVDKIVDLILLEGAHSGIVNAGGDIRTIGNTHHAIHLRDPNAPQKLPYVTRLKRKAIASSGGYFSEDGQTTQIYNSKKNALVKSKRAFCVISPRCVISEAFTKIAFCDLDKAKKLTERWDSFISIVSI